METACPALIELALATRAEPEGELRRRADAQFVQENVPERIEQPADT
ncbi:hypothetical protein [Nonomuraea sp. NPDC003201]